MVLRRLICCALMATPVWNGGLLYGDFEFFGNLEFGQTQQFTKVSYGVDSTDDELFDFDFTDGSDMGILDAELDGFDLFDDPPDNLSGSFFASTMVETTGDPNSATSITVTHKGAGGFMPDGSSSRLDLFYDTSSRVSFTPFFLTPSEGPANINVDFTHTYTATDPVSSGSFASLFNQISGSLKDGSGEEVFTFSTFGDFDSGRSGETDPFQSSDFGDLDIEIIPDLDELGELDISIEGEDDALVEPDVPLDLDTNSLGSIFADGFESGDVSAWTMDSSNSFILTISSSDPNVRFNVSTIPEPSTYVLIALGVGCIAWWQRRRG